MINRALLIITVILTVSNVSRAQLYSWQTYTNKDAITSLNYFGGFVWATTTGGLVKFTQSLDTIVTYVKNDGLGSIDLNFSCYAGDSIAYFGSADGVLNRLDLRDISFTTYTFTGRDGANVELFHADTSAGYLWIASSIGVIKFDRFRNGGEVKEIYRTLGNFGTEIPVNDVAIFNGKIYAATGEGLAYADDTNLFLLDPNEWKNIPTDQNSLTNLCIIVDRLWIGGTNGFSYLMDGDTALTVRDTGVRVRSLSPSGSQLLVISDSNMTYLVYDDRIGVEQLNVFPPDQLNFLQYSFAGTTQSGIYHYSQFTYIRVPVPGPTSNDLIGGGITPDGYLYAVSRQGNPARMKNNVWDTLTAPDAEKISSTIGDDGSFWVGTFARGAMQYLPVGTRRNFHGGNSQLKGPNLYPDSVGVINGMYTDPAGRIWFSSYQASPMRPLVMFDPHDSLWTWFDASDGVVDSNCTCVAAGIGMAALGTQSQGVMLVRYGADPFNHSGDTLKYYSRSVLLPSATVNTMIFDRDNRLWVGTPLGLAYFDADIDFFHIVALPDGVSSDVRALASDSRNNLWVGTTDGLAFISYGQSQKIAFNTDNSELVANEIQGLSFDHESGKLLIFTRGGLSILDYSLSPVDSAAQNYAYPNPFVIQLGGNATLQFKINQRAEVRIYNVAGELIRITDVDRGWDGRNDAGALVASGVYIYHIIAEDKSRHTGKLFVVRK